MKIGIGSDHGGFDLKQHIIFYLSTWPKIDVVDLGTFNKDSTDYPIFGKKVAEAVIDGSVKRGIVICGTGIGISIAANRIAGVRAALCNDVTTARLSREHNDANVLALGARQIARELAEKIVDTFLSTDFEGGRHAVRVAKIDETKFFLDSVDNTSKS